MKNKLFFILALTIVIAGCKSEEPETQPVAKFTYSVNQNVVTFTNQSTNAKKYYWNFGDGSTSSSTNPVKTYSNTGSYSVTLTATNITKSNSYSKTIEITQTPPPEEQTPTAKFTYKVQQPLKVVLTNTSTNATSYLWEFGDGSTSTEKNPTHRYSGLGVYRIKLTASNSTKSSTHEENVTVEAPTNCYVTGFSINKIPNNNYYYQVQLTDDYTWSKTTYFYTDWYLLSSANLPYSHTLTTMKKLDMNDKYVLRLYKNSEKQSGQASGSGFWTTTITSSDLKKYPESITRSNTQAEIKLDFYWK